MRPNVYIIAGPNGAGKTTFAREFLPHYADCKVFINADTIASELSPAAPERAAIGAGRLMLQQIELQARQGTGFGFETTLSGKGHLHVVRGLRNRGYNIHIFYLWVPSAEFALSRVQERVARGGHDIPEQVVRRRYERSVRNFLVDYCPLAERWILYDNSAKTPLVIAFQELGRFVIANPKLYNDISGHHGAK